MANFQSALRRTRRQKTLQTQLEGADLSEAISLAVRTLFRFTHRASDSKALWSDSHVVWLGRSTYLNWCLEDSEFDIPWVVAKAKGAPRDKAKLREAVAAQVTDLFVNQLAKLPRKQTGNWLPLP
jgi:hypothetical protein